MSCSVNVVLERMRGCEHICLVQRWAEVGDDRKQEYQKKADAAKAEYEKAMERYRAQQN